jgi:tetratricopeptide (TPR) repeat protein
MRSRIRLAAALPLALVLLAGSACQNLEVRTGSSTVTFAGDPPLFEGMGSHKRKVTTKSPDAQRYFDQGLVWTYAFNHDEAIRSFEHAAKLDPACAMAYWGIALCHGPHINNPVMDEERSHAAWTALGKATALKQSVTPVERALIEALAARYVDPAAGDLPLSAEERAPLDKAYADAMERVYAAYPRDPDVGTLYAESLMDLRPWDLYDHRTGEPRPETPTIVATIERVLEIQPDHPGANHLYIHAVEASNTPDRAIAAADRLRTLVPGSGHLVHMPAHIDVRVGRWALSAEQNRQASRIDNEYRKISPTQGIYRIYMAHNDHFLAWSCMMLGRKQEALSAARDMVRKIPEDFKQAAAPFVDQITPIEVEVLLRFGMWDDILREPEPPEYLPITRAFWRFARASAYAAKGQLDEAASEQMRFREVVREIPHDAMMAQNSAQTVLAIAELVLDGEIDFRRGQTDQAVEKLRQAAVLEDDLRYMEPPDWVQPVRHALGAILLASDRAEEAEEVYREDLKRWPENGWGLFGLAEALKAQNKAEAEQVETRFQKVWATADTEITASCLCVHGAR